MTTRRFTRFWRVLTVLCLLVTGSSFASAEIRLANAAWEIRIRPATLGLTAVPAGKEPVELSVGREGLGTVTDLRQAAERASWRFEDRGISIRVRLEGRDLHVQIQSEREGSFTWPVQRMAPFRALIWPRAEGLCIPLDDTRWTDYLIGRGDWDTLEGLSMSFWGLDRSDAMVTCLATCPYNNAIRFERNEDGLEASFTHEFTRFQRPKECGFIFSLGEASSPVEPARRFRRWLIENDVFVTMKAKSQKVPNVERLLGAAHVYLWGDDPFTRHDVPRRKWQSFCQELARQAGGPGDSPGKRIRRLTPPARWKQIVELSEAEWPSVYLKTEVAKALSELLTRRDLYEPQAWSGLTLPNEATDVLARNRDDLPVAGLCRLNSLLLYAAFPQFMAHPDNWGDGVSIKMLERFREAGLDRLRLCVAGWEGIEKRPYVAELADEMGYLLGTYDSYHSIHDPALQGTDDTWTTAQFDRQLYERGKILRRDGTPRGGFKGVGAKLSPIAARPYVEKRVRRNMKNVPYSYYFVDCDAYGEAYDDYSPEHPCGQADDVAARIDRLRWIGETFKVPIGSEGGCFRFAGVIHVSEGIFGPLFGWGDPDMGNKESGYYLGGYYPPDGPRIFVQQVPVKEEYERLYYDPRFRLPLYEIVFHDSIVTTHHWQNASLKFTNLAETVALTELLYMAPPMYHMNLDEFEKHRVAMKRQYDCFSPLHREVGFAPMTDFDWLSADRLLQRTVFGDCVELVVNYSEDSRRYSAVDIPGRCVLARWKDSGKTRLLTPVSGATETESH